MWYLCYRNYFPIGKLLLLLGVEPLMRIGYVLSRSDLISVEIRISVFKFPVGN